jgi:GNAT superfamily N-acetyltransferase
VALAGTANWHSLKLQSGTPQRHPNQQPRDRYHPRVPGSLTIRPAQSRDIPWMQGIEIAAGRLFAEIGMHDVAEDGAHESDVLAGYVAVGRAWVAEQDGAVCGYALVDVLDGAAHLEQVTVHPDHGRQGIGGRLIEAVADWARDQGSDVLTLLTFRDVAWNGPYYRRLGFVDRPTPRLAPSWRRFASTRRSSASMSASAVRCA